MQVRYDEAMIRGAVRTFVWRRLVLDQKLLWATAGIMLLFCTWLLARGDRSWLTIVAGGATVLPPLFLLTGWYAHHSSSLGRLRAMPEPEAEFAFDAQGFRVTSSLGEMRLPWTSVAEVWARPAAWMLFTAPNQFATLPIQCVPPETLEHLRSWLGGKVIDV